ncbi:hypothetical protein KAR91_20240 [Candidatus Pacearchaeota archaeon]|nr:hypothetical protein [Candidatus Pacearchaeota archaeon]
MDKLAERGRFDLIQDYCNTIDAKKDDIINVWFDSAQPSGILINNTYFARFKVIEEESETGFDMNFGNHVLNIPGKDVLSIWEPLDMMSALRSHMVGEWKVIIKFAGFCGQGEIIDYRGVTSPFWAEKHRPKNYKSGYTKTDFEMRVILD